MKIFKDMKVDTICIAYRAKTKNKDIHDIHKGIALRHIHEKNKSLCSSDYPRYNLIEYLVHHILSGYDVHNGLCCDDKLFDQILMPLGAVTHREAISMVWSSCPV